MKIFIIGSYSGKNKEEIIKHIEKATEAGKTIMEKEHLPFVAQSMFAFWEEDTDMKMIMKTCFDWIRDCDAVLVLNIGKKGGGTWSALEVAKKNKKKIFRGIGEIPLSK